MLIILQRKWNKHRMQKDMYYFERVLRVIKSCGKSGLVATTAAHMANLKSSSVGSGLWSILHWPQFYKGGNGRSKETPISQKTMTWNPACLRWHLAASGEVLIIKVSVRYRFHFHNPLIFVTLHAFLKSPDFLCSTHSFYLSQKWQKWQI